jgi:hypothetical protein
MVIDLDQHGFYKLIKSVLENYYKIKIEEGIFEDTLYPIGKRELGVNITSDVYDKNHMLLGMVMTFAKRIFSKELSTDDMSYIKDNLYNRYFGEPKEKIEPTNQKLADEFLEEIDNMLINAQRHVR